MHMPGTRLPPTCLSLAPSPLHAQALTLDALSGMGDDPAMNPILLPPRTRADVVQDRPAGGMPSEVAAANPGLAAAVPETAGQSSGPADTATKVADYIQDTYNIPTSDESKEAIGSGPKQGNAGADAGTGTGAGGAAGGQPAEAGAGLRLGDGSGMEVPELAVLPNPEPQA